MKRNIIALAAAISILGAGVASGQNYPNKPIRIVTSGIGSGTDFTARIIAQGISGPLGQPVVVENRPSSLIGEFAAKASADGYTLVVGSGSFLMGPLLQKMPYDVVRDFAAVTLATKSPSILVVYLSLPVKSVEELIALAKARPGQLNYGSSGTGSTPHLSAELFKAMAGVNIVRVPYKSTPQVINDLISGQVQLTFGNTVSVMPHVKSGRLRALAVTSAQPSALLPGLPTVAASGLPGYESISIDTVLVPTKTPAAIINRLNQEIVLVLNRAEVKEQFLNAGSEVVGSSPAELAAEIKSEMTTMGKVIKDAGIKAD